MKTCKRCKGKGWVFVKTTVLTGKVERIFGFEIPQTTEGMSKSKCSNCFGKGFK